LQEKQTSPPNEKLANCFSIRLFIIALMIILFISCSVFVWLASYVGSTQAITELSKSIVNKVSDNVVSFIQSELVPASLMVQTISSDHLLNVVNFTDPLPYLFQKSLIYQTSGCGFWYANRMWGYTNTTTIINGELSTQTTLTVYRKPTGYIGVELWMCKPSDGSLAYLISNQTTSVNIPTRDYWVNTFSYFNANPSATVYYGPPYLVLNSTYNIYASVYLHDPVAWAVNKTKKVVGLTKSNISLFKIEKFLSKLELIGNGYVVVLESNNLVIGGSINTTAADRVSRVSAFQLIDKDAGTLMTDIKLAYGSLSNSSEYFSISSLGVNYFITRTPFIYENIRWNVFLVVYKDDIEHATNVNTGISVAVSVFVCFLGLVASILIGHLITQPLRYLEGEFTKIKKFDLENVHFAASSFKEIHAMYLDLHEMVMWLKEFKSFLPETIFNQLRQIESEIQTEKKDNKKDDLAAIDNNSHSSASSSHMNSSSRRSELISNGGLFRLGLSEMRASVIHLRLLGFNRLPPSDITSMFSKLAAGLSTLCKNVQGDLQILGVDEFLISFTDKGQKESHVKALECSLKISRALDTNIVSAQQQTLKYFLGVSSGTANIGNLGTNNLRFYSIVGPIINNSKRLTNLCSVVHCKILADHETMQSCKSQFVYRPIDRYELEENRFQPLISTVYEVVKENHYENDGKFSIRIVFYLCKEWMYELEAQKFNSKYKGFEEAFGVLEETSLNNRDAIGKLKNSIAILQGYANEEETTEVTNRLLKIFQILLSRMEKGDDGSVISHYRSIVKNLIVSQVQHEEVDVVEQED